MSITLTSLIADTRIHIADAQCAQSAFWEDSDLTLYINNALLTLFSVLPPDALRNYEDVESIDLVSGTANYNLPASFYLEYSVIYNDVQCRKLKYSDQTIINQNTYVKSLASQPGYTINDDDIYLYPTPAANSTGGGQLFYLAKPPVLTGATSVNLDACYAPIITKLAGGRAISIKESVEQGKALIQSAMEDLKIYTGKDIKEETE